MIQEKLNLQALALASPEWLVAHVLQARPAPEPRETDQPYGDLLRLLKVSVTRPADPRIMLPAAHEIPEEGVVLDFLKVKVLPPPVNPGLTALIHQRWTAIKDRDQSAISKLHQAAAERAAALAAAEARAEQRRNAEMAE
jgi:hypothetical protein